MDWRMKMTPVVCPKCGSQSVFHYTDAYVLRKPVLREDGALDLVEYDTNEFDDSFFECFDCGYRPVESELIPEDV
jgi:DNA-directed RNA polymerase subunit RPC12/RpoP